MQHAAFKKTVLEYYKKNQRSLPWRENTDPYFVLVSELMLQQTQVDRVVPKFRSFMQKFPTVIDLANANLSEVLAEWSGLGYNRRAKFLHQAAQKVREDFSGQIPNSLDELVSLSGVGKNTAGAILAYAFNQPVVYIETNIRSVFIHEFFADAEQVSDAELLPLIDATLDTSNPREWYWALMDYGTMLKKTNPNPSRRSKHHVKQSKFEGSKRQIRGKVIRLLIDGRHTHGELLELLADERAEDVISDLLQEGLLVREKDYLQLA